MTDCIYHIYKNKQCIHSNLSKDEFSNIWETLDLDSTCYEYEELASQKEISLNSSY